MDYVAFGTAISSDPRFCSAAHDLCVRMLDCHAANPPLAQLMADRAQAHIVGICYHLHPTANAAAVLRLLPPDTASRNRVTAHLHALERRGALVAAPRGRDARTRNLMLAPAFQAWVDRWVDAVVLPALPFVPEPPVALDDPSARQGWFSRWVAAQTMGVRLTSRLPEVRQFLDLRGGYVVINELLRRDYALPGAVTERLSRRNLAARYGLTRTHVIDLLAALEAKNWVAEGPLGPEPTDAMRAQTRIWHGLHLGAAALVLSGVLMPTIEEALAARAAVTPS
ncbi:hypothetical protein FHS79_003073 [Polymorphobacter multimanifer]|uniref:Uncharacterized protein n=1 Tax=Polymorphobacter multimanifer TaxID=1070431 RepID=A0A841L8Y4_9SPHN|nr:hypothetical protein [Polymorphobacter multimanifer]MBB6228880.1 hypothetical protein [Polymorphobacter multimanifer]